MTSARWIEHFYRNACLAQKAIVPVSLDADDIRALEAARPGQVSLQSGRILQQRVSTSDRTLQWAVRLYVREQERHQSLFAGMSGLQPNQGWRTRVIEQIPPDLMLLLLGCRARVAARFFSALAKRSEAAAVKTFYETLAAEERAQFEFAEFARPRVSESKRPESACRCLSIAVGVGIATRLWIRHRVRLRQSGQTFAEFVAAAMS